jgi:outer membrane protein assembly complex protein YaeT
MGDLAQKLTPRDTRRRWLRRLIVASVVVAMLLAGFVGFLHTPPGRRYVVSRITDVLRQQNIQFDTDDLSYNLLDLSIRLRNLRIRARDAPDLPRFAEIDEARFDLSLTQLLRRRYMLEDGQGRGVRVHYYVSETGRDNLPRPPHDPEQPSQPLDYLIDQLSVFDARARYENRAQHIDLSLPVSSMVIDGSVVTHRHNIRVTAAGGTIAVGDRHASLDRLTGEFDLGDNDVVIANAEVDVERSRLALTGSIVGFDAAQVDLAVQGRVDAARASSLAGLKDPVAGTVTIDASVKGPIATPALSGRVSIPALSFRTLHNVQVSTNASYDLLEKRATFSSLDVRAPWGRVAGDGVVAMTDTGDSRLTATLTDIDAATLMRALDVEYIAATRIDGRIEASWPSLQYEKATGQAEATLTPTRNAVSRSVMPVAGAVHATGDGRRIRAQLIRVRAAGAELNGRVTMTDQLQLSGSVGARAADIGRTLAAAERFLGSASGSPAPVSGAIQANVRLGGTARAPAIDGNISADALSVGAANGIALRSTVGYVPSAVTVERLDLMWDKARASARGRVELAGARRLNLEVGATDFEVPELLKSVNKTTVPAGGALSLHGNVAGTVSRPTGSITIRGDDLSAYSEMLGTLAADVTLAGGQIVLSRLLIEKPQPDGAGRVEGSGTYQLDQHSFTFDIRSNNVQLLGLALPDGEILRGPVELAATGAGTVSDPVANVEFAAPALQFGAYELGRIALNAVVARKQATVAATADRFGVNADAVIGVETPYPATVKVHVNDMSLQAVPLNLQARLDGVLRASMEGTGDLANPENARATATIDAFAGTWKGHSFSVDAPAQLAYAHERLAIERLRVVAQDSSVVVSGALPLTDRAGKGVLTIDGRANLSTLVQYAPAGTEVAGSGEMTLTGAIRGTLEAIDPDLVLTVTNGSLVTPDMKPGLSNLNLRVKVAKGEANIDQLAANWGVARLEASGRVPLEVLPALPVEIPQKGGPARFTASVVNLDPAEIPGAPEGVSGRISVDAQIVAARADLATLEGRIAFPALQVAFNGLTLAQEAPSLVRIAGGTATVDALNLSGSVGTLAATGTVGLIGSRPLDVGLNGNLNIAVISMFTDVVRAEGDTRLQVAVRGTADAPELNGFVDLTNASFVVDEPGVAAEDVTGRVEMAGRRISLANLTGSLNGGRLDGSGYVVLGQGGIADVALELTTDDVAFDAPLDLRSLSDASIRLVKSGDTFVLGGQVTIDDAGLTGDINFDEGLLAAMGARRQLDLTEERNALLERVRFNVNVDTASPILVDNNLAKAEVTVDLRVTGTPYEPGLAGRLTVLQDGEITLNERRYEVEQGVVTFIDERRIVPQFDLRLNTSAGNYDVTLAVSGTPGETETTLTSDPTLPEPDIMALLVTGRTLEEMRGEEFEVAKEQVLSYLTGRVGSQLGRGIQRATGLSEVRIEPQLIANEADPSARLTIGQEVTDDVKLVYSTSLTEGDDQIWIAEYDVTRRFQSRAVRQRDNSYRLEFLHDMRFGGVSEPRRIPRQRPTVNSITVTGAEVVGETEMRRMLGIEEGKLYDFFRARDGLLRIEEHLREGGWLQSRVRMERHGDNRAVDVTLQVRAGPRVELQFVGATPPAAVVEDVETQWNRGVFDTQRIDDANEVLVAWLMTDNHLQAKVNSTVEETGPNQRRVVFHIEPGTRSTAVRLAFEGASGIDSKGLDDIINEQNLEKQLFTDPLQVTTLLQRYYREQGYLSAEIEKPIYEFDGTLARVVLKVREGPRFFVRNVSTSGNAALPSSTLLQGLPVVSGDPFLPFAAENALDRIRDVYWQRGYNDVRSDYELAVDRDAGRVDVVFSVVEGLQTIVGEVVVAGNVKTTDHLVREQVELDTDQPLDVSKLAQSRRNLYEIGAFSVVDITREELPQNGDSGQQPVRLNVSVREVQPIQLRYGASYDTERGPGGTVDLSNHNTLGKARVIGLRARYDGEIREARAYYSQPSLRYLPVQLTGTVYFFEDRNPSTTTTRSFTVARKGASIEGETTLRDRYVWGYGYRYERARTLNPEPTGILDEIYTVAPLTLTLTRETRDEVLDATRGAFLSHAFEYSPSWLGAERAYVRYLGQYFHYFALQPERRKRFTNETIRPRLVFATGVRLGLGRGFGDPLPTGERFFAGGSNTLRGSEQNAIGPIGPERTPLGGAAMLLLNNEVRFPLISIVDGVVFSDIGNVYPRLSDFSLSDLRESAGAGLRLRTPWFLLRADYGILLDRREQEPRGRFYFSIGQAF